MRRRLHIREGRCGAIYKSQGERVGLNDRVLDHARLKIQNKVTAHFNGDHLFVTTHSRLFNHNRRVILNRALRIDLRRRLIVLLYIRRVCILAVTHLVLLCVAHVWSLSSRMI